MINKKNTQLLNELIVELRKQNDALTHTNVVMDRMLNQQDNITRCMERIVDVIV